MFFCIGCQRRKTEKDRRFEQVDWCNACCDKELKRTSAGSTGGVPNVRRELPAYMRKR